MQHPFPVHYPKGKTGKELQSISEWRKMSKFQDLPEELILTILSYLEVSVLISCGQVSRKIRKITHDNSLWVTANFVEKIVKTELLEIILGKGCMILNITNCDVIGNLSSNIKSQLRVLNLSLPDAWNCIYLSLNTDVFEKLLFSSCSLQHLVMRGIQLTPKMAQSICNNGKTLQILNLNYSSVEALSYPFVDDLSYLQEVSKCCQELKEINFNEVEGLPSDDLEVLAKKIPPNVEKLDLSTADVMDDHVKILLSRCNKIKALSLNAMWITDFSFTNIRRYLNLTLEELSLTEYKSINFTGIFELKSMPRLKCLKLRYKEEDWKEAHKQELDTICQYLRQHLHHLMIKTLFINSR